MTRLLAKIIRPFMQLMIVAMVIGTFLYLFYLYEDTHLFYIRLTEAYGIIGIIYLYFSLIISPFYAVFSDYPFISLVRLARRPIGQGAFIFGFLHGTIALFKLLGGIEGLFFITGKDLYAILAGICALFLLTVLGITSFDWAIRLLGGKQWKSLHQATYVVGVLVVIHVFLTGSHFRNTSGHVSKIAIVAIGYLVFLEFLRIVKWWKMKQLKQQALPQAQ